MTRKDYILIAEIVLRTAATSQFEHNENCLYWANKLADTNPRFDRERFLKAAGYYRSVL